MRNVLVLCHGNICRSPLCAIVLAQGEDLSVISAGLKVIDKPQRAAKKIRDAAMLLGLNLDNHRSQGLTPQILLWANVVIYMDGGNLTRLREFRSMCFQRYHIVGPHDTYCLGKFADPPVTRIPDPAFMRRDSRDFSETFRLIVGASRNLRDVIACGGARGQG